MPLFSSSFSISQEKIDVLDTNIHVGVIELKYNTVLIWRFEELSVTSKAATLSSFGKLSPYNNFPHLRKFSHRYTCRFASTYLWYFHHGIKLRTNNLFSLPIVAFKTW
jgi:hypothetical protein